MDNPGEILRLCRLCLVKDQVNIPIFEEQGDIRQIFLKISSCLPVKVSRDDKLPKKICDGCSNKLDLLYEFWSSTANAEKTLLSWLGQAGVKDVDETISAVAQQIAKPTEPLVKEETETIEDIHLASQVEEGSQSFEESSKNEAEAPPAKRARRTAAVKAQINITPESDDEDDMDAVEPLTKMEDESDESEGEEKDPSFTEVAGTSADDQAGPSGVGKEGVEAPKHVPVAKVLSRISWQCSDCSRKFPDLGTLKTHMESNCQEINKKNAVIDAQKLLSKLPGIRAKLISNNTTNNVSNRLRKSNKMKVARKSKPAAKIKTKRSQDDDQKKFFFLCTRCPQIFTTQELLDAHEDKCTESENNANKKASTKPSKSLFQPYHFDRFKNLYVCMRCFQEFDFKSSIDEHLKTEHPGFSCKLCDMSFEELVEFGYHSAVHDPSQTMTCPCCPFRTTVKPKLAFHIQTEHPVDTQLMSVNDLTFTCVVCSKSFYNNRKLAHHQKNYHKVSIEIEPSMGARLMEPTVRSKPLEPLLCDTCGKEFISKYRLERHQRAMHQGLKPYVCGYCGRAFTGKDTMKKHERIHTGEKPYSCEYCGKCFRQPGPFSVHLRIHTGERPYTCKFCKKGFITNQTKKAHMKNCVVRMVDMEYNQYMYVPVNDYS